MLQFRPEFKKGVPTMFEIKDGSPLDMPECDYDPSLEDRNFSQTTEEDIGLVIYLITWLLSERGLFFLMISALIIALLLIL